MTKREFYEAVVATAADEEIIAFATKELQALDTKNEKAKAKRDEKKQADAPLVAGIISLLNEKGAMPAAAIGAALEVSTAKAVALLKPMVAAGTVTKTEIKVTGKGKQNVYSMAEVANSVEE